MTIKCDRPIIARVQRDTATLCVDLVDMCDRACRFWDCCRESCATLVISRAGCPQPEQPKYEWDKCKCTMVKIEPDEPEHPKGTVEYPLFSLDYATGGGCFYLDDLFLSQKPGRYDAKVFMQDDDECGSKKVLKGEFQIELQDKTRVRRVRTTPGVCHA